MLRSMKVLVAIAGMLALVGVANIASAQLHPEEHIPALPKHKPAPKPTRASTPVMDDVKYLAPEDAPDFGRAPRRYHPPDGFAGHPWGQLRVTFARLPEQPQMVRAAWTSGMARQPELFCMGGAVGMVCSLDSVLNSLVTRVEGGGFHVLSEYKIEEQGFRFSESGVVLFPVIYQFCANWYSTKKEVPKNFDDLDRFCGMRMLFETESRLQLRNLPEDHVTRYDMVLGELISRYGKPAGFFKRGRVTIETQDDPADKRSAEDRKFSTWRWCPASDRSLATSCAASIVLSIDPDSGRAVVLFSTPELWAYVYARQHGNGGGDPLFAVMHARPPSRHDQATN